MTDRAVVGPPGPGLCPSRGWSDADMDTGSTGYSREG
jgi:hypothetical protein